MTSWTFSLKPTQDSSAGSGNDQIFVNKKIGDKKWRLKSILESLRSLVCCTPANKFHFCVRLVISAKDEGQVWDSGKMQHGNVEIWSQSYFLFLKKKISISDLISLAPNWFMEVCVLIVCNLIISKFSRYTILRKD